MNAAVPGPGRHPDEGRGVPPRHPTAHPPPGNAPLLPHEAPEGTELHIVGVHLYLQDDNGRVLLGLRHPASAFAGGEWHALAGHCEREETTSCLVRESREEAGLIIEPDEVEPAHLVHSVDSPAARPRIQLFYRARHWSGVPQVREPDRCVEWRWWNPKDLPANVVPYTRQAVEANLSGRLYSHMGWT
ncbi:NUDIX domain-containing protein [Streptomyces sp. BE308]|uniref:NUDIX hydrolase n=1 Tax=Streptomyces sp. BE308 TaxID=3002529 RepID=UPI002E781DC5|nr:NUDIX domain-containing protein [Streptomyces sp. BE308]MEE1790255.1 NUDIX domain-containing protein [Streptomyces sp. BE308]